MHMKVKKQLHGLRQRWMVNSMSIVAIIMLIVCGVFSAGVVTYYYSNVQNAMKAQAKASIGFPTAPRFCWASRKAWAPPRAAFGGVIQQHGKVTEHRIVRVGLGFLFNQAVEIFHDGKIRRFELANVRVPEDTELMI